MADKAWRLAFAAALCGVAALSLAAPSHAASRVCRQLEADLVGASRNANPRQVKKYDNAIRRQGQQIANVRAQARNADCGFALFGRHRAQCAALDATLKRMNTNLDALQRTRARLAGGGTRHDRKRILAMLDANNCRGRAVEARALERAAKPPPQARETRDTSKTAPREEAHENPNRIVIRRSGTAASPAMAGEYRTLCVRTCDGYFFPMSNAATLGDFQRDQANCESACPGTDMQVFYQDGIGGDPLNMTSAATGKPYSELPTAYLYKRQDVPASPSCGCNAARNFEIIAGNPQAGAYTPGGSGTSSFVPVPMARPDPAADPERLANDTGSLDSETIQKPAQNSANAPTDAETSVEERRIRVVGPVFLPAPEAATDPQVPAPTEGR